MVILLIATGVSEKISVGQRQCPVSFTNRNIFHMRKFRRHGEKFTQFLDFRPKWDKPNGLQSQS